MQQSREQDAPQNIVSTADSRVMKHAWRIRVSRRTLVIGMLVLVVFAWLLTPALRAITLVANPFHRSAPAAPSDLPVQHVHFQATDGVRLAGWLIMRSPTAPTIILVHGFKGSRADMLPWTHFLFAAGYNLLLYDSRGCGESEGWTITLGTHEPNDIVGAVHYLQQRPDLKTKRFGALGMSLGAGEVLLAAAREPALAATVADSAWIDEHAQTDRMGSFSFIPLLPYEPALVDDLIGAHLADTRPLADIGKIAPRAVMLIHSADDQNTTTPPSGERQLYQAADQPKQEWIAPSGGHVGALRAHPHEYEQRVLAFFARYLLQGQGQAAAPTNGRVVGVYERPVREGGHYGVYERGKRWIDVINFDKPGRVRDCGPSLRAHSGSG